MILVSFLVAASMAAEKPICDSNIVTRNCAFFIEHETQARIYLPDGTSFRNPMFDGSAVKSESILAINENDAKLGTSYGGLLNSSDSMNEAASIYAMSAAVAQTEYLQILNRSKLPLEYQLYLSAMSSQLLKSPNQKFKIFWPIGSKKPTMQALTASEIMSGIKKYLTPKQFKAIEKLSASRTKEFEVQLQRQQEMENERVRQQAQEAAKEEEQKTINAEKREERKRHVNDLYKFAKDEVISIVTRGKSESNWTDVERKLVEKIHGIKLKLPEQNELPVTSNCGGVRQDASVFTAENAVYFKDERIILCPDLLYHPDVDLVAILGHEIGHSIDSCNFQMPSWKFDQEALAKFIETEPLNELAKSELSNYIGPDLVNYNGDLNMEISDLDLLKKMSDKGIVKKVSENVPLKKHPLYSEFRCLSNTFHFTEVEASDIKLTEEILTRTTKNAIDKLFTKSTIDRYISAMKKYPQCFRAVSHVSELGEAEGDAIGALVRDRYLSRHPIDLNSESERIGTVAFLASTYCPVKMHPPSISPAIVNAQNRSDPHPEPLLRVRDIALNLPRMAKLFDCRRVGKSCFDEFSTSDTLKSKRSVEKSEEANR